MVSVLVFILSLGGGGVLYRRRHQKRLGDVAVTPSNAGNGVSGVPERAVVQPPELPYQSRVGDGPSPIRPAAPEQPVATSDE